MGYDLSAKNRILGDLGYFQRAGVGRQGTRAQDASRPGSAHCNHNAGRTGALLALAWIISIASCDISPHAERTSATSSSAAAHTSSAVPATYTLGSGGALCGKKELETALAYKAIHDGDKVGALSLVARGEVDYLVAGTTVHAFTESGELVAVTVESGTSLGKTCWMPTKMLGTRNGSN
jgi:hypothetical protein